MPVTSNFKISCPGLERFSLFKDFKLKIYEMARNSKVRFTCMQKFD